jgi:uncharacterized protein (TIGR03083 family)
VTPTLATLITALEQTWTGTSSACTNLTPEQWDLPTEVPGWSVKDNVSHIAGLEAVLLGEPMPDHTPPDYPHVRNDAGRYMEIAVDVRRSVPGDAVLAELRDVAQRRLAVLRALPETALDDEIAGFFGPINQGRMLGIRVFDSWVHEQDVRRGLGHPGGLDTAAAEISRLRLTRALSGLAEDVPAAAGRTLVVETTGAIPSVSTLRLGEDASYADGDSGGADVRLTVDFELYLRLGAGRLAYDDVGDEVRLDGDAGLGAELARHFAVTP